MAAIAVILLPFRPLWALGLFASAYAIMFFGHFVFERNIPTIFKEPTTPFVVAFAVIRRMLAGGADPARSRADGECAYRACAAQPLRRGSIGPTATSLRLAARQAPSLDRPADAVPNRVFVQSSWERIHDPRAEHGPLRAPLQGDDSMADPITYADFAKLELRVAKVLEARPHPNADRLLLIQVDVGDEQKQIVAGIRQHYSPEQLVGKLIVIVNNLEPAMLRGESSNGMLLAATSNEKVVVLTVDDPDCVVGAKIK